MEALRNNSAANSKAKPQPKHTTRRRQSEEGKAKEDKLGETDGKQPKRPRGAKDQEPQLTPKELADRRRTSDKEGFSQVFRKRVRGSQGGDMVSTPTQTETEDRSEGN
eukprot:12131534-Heterocapsa_arctica.AAC.1